MLALGDELVVRVVFLVGVVSGAIGEDDMQGHIESAVVDIASQFRLQLAAAEEDDARLDGQSISCTRATSVSAAAGAIPRG